MRHFWLLAVVVLVLVVPARSAAAMGTDRYREQISRDYAARVEARDGVVDDPLEIQRVAEILRRLLGVAEAPDFSWRLRILQVPVPNAFALPNGFIYVNQGLLDLGTPASAFSKQPLGMELPHSADGRLQPDPHPAGTTKPDPLEMPGPLPSRVTDDELAFVLGHEMAHVIQGHTMRALGADHTISRLLRRYGGFGYTRWARLANQALTQTIESGFSREYETEADRWGLTYMREAGYDPRAALRFFERLRRLDGGGSLQVFRTHPPTSDRVANVRKWLKTMPLPHEPAGTFNGPPTPGLPVVWFPLRPPPPPPAPPPRPALRLKEPAEFRTTPSEAAAPAAPERIPEEVASRLVRLRAACNLIAKALPASFHAGWSELARQRCADAVVELAVDRFRSQTTPWPGGAVTRMELTLTTRVRRGRDGTLAGTIPIRVVREATLQAGAISRDQLFASLLDDAAARLQEPLWKCLAGILPALAAKSAPARPPPSGPERPQATDAEGPRGSHGGPRPASTPGLNPGSHPESQPAMPTAPPAPRPGP